VKTLHVYGNSLAAGPGPSNPLKGWANFLADKLSIPLINNALIGCSLEYSIKTFVKNLHTIGDDDIVIFMVNHHESCNFLYFKQQNDIDPKKSYFKIANAKHYTSDFSWFVENQAHIDWYKENEDFELMLINHEGYFRLIKDFAWTKPNCTFLLFTGVEGRLLDTKNITLNSYKIPGGEIPGETCPKNFLRSAVDLRQVSYDEVVGVKEYWTIVDVTSKDPRMNHLTVSNLHILTNLINESINTLSVDNITTDKFQTNLFEPVRSSKQYLNYIEKGIFQLHPKILEKIQKIENG